MAEKSTPNTPPNEGGEDHGITPAPETSEVATDENGAPVENPSG